MFPEIIVIIQRFIQKVELRQVPATLSRKFDRSASGNFTPGYLPQKTLHPTDISPHF